MIFLHFLLNKKIEISRKFKATSGFTLVELIVVMAIATTMLTVVVVQQSKWNDDLIVSTQSYELAFMVRQAQLYGLAVRQYNAGTGDKFDTGYGIHLDINQPSRYIFFADKNKNRIYDTGELLETKTFTRGVTINRFCDVTSVGVETCSTSTGNMRRLGITFVRPEPKSNILFLTNGGTATPGTLNARAFIYLRSPKGIESLVKVESSGQISIVQ